MVSPIGNWRLNIFLKRHIFVNGRIKMTLILAQILNFKKIKQ